MVISSHNNYNTLSIPESFAHNMLKSYLFLKENEDFKKGVKTASEDILKDIKEEETGKVFCIFKELSDKYELCYISESIERAQKELKELYYLESSNFRLIEIKLNKRLEIEKILKGELWEKK